MKKFFLASSLFLVFPLCKEASPANDKDMRCRLAGRADDYTLALSWHPAFCEWKSGKKECRDRDRTQYQARNFTLHGLWPNKNRCGKNYGFCRGSKKFSNFCQYESLRLSLRVKEDLARVMPSARAGTCLERYQWFKHGGCETEWNVEEYYAISITLTDEFNRVAGPLMARSTGGTVKESDFFRVIDAAFGRDAHKRLQLKCRKGDLVDLYIKLPPSIGKGGSLRNLIQQAEPVFRSNCGGRFKVDAIDD